MLPSLLFFVFLAGCSSINTGVTDTLRSFFVSPPQPDSRKLDKRFAYLRVTIGKRVNFLALGMVEPHPAGGIEVWYSANGEILRLQNGRLLSITGTFDEWRGSKVESPLPTWRELVALPQPLTWRRSRDLMPGYRFGVRDTLKVSRIQPPSNSVLQTLDPGKLTWFEEVIINSSDAVERTIPPTRYAVDLNSGNGLVVYAEQCISREMCIAWQRWRAGQ